MIFSDTLDAQNHVHLNSSLEELNSTYPEKSFNYLELDDDTYMYWTEFNGEKWAYLFVSSTNRSVACFQYFKAKKYLKKQIEYLNIHAKIVRFPDKWQLKDGDHEIKVELSYSQNEGGMGDYYLVYSKQVRLLEMNK